MAESLGPIDSTARKALKDLSKIQPKEFEKHFREWMERDDVARSLQAKLRRDLIANFNTTSLGKQLMTNAGPMTHKTGLDRLTLSPLILALNTLVAEFLYAQNCHFSLSVFCAEVPYRNTIPDFENTQSFRFTKLEIAHIIEAISGSSKCEDLKLEIYRNYRDHRNFSLLYTIVHSLMQAYYNTLKSGQLMTKSQVQSNLAKQRLTAPPPSLSNLSSSASPTVVEPPTIETDFPSVYNQHFDKQEIAREQLTNYRLLNKYLMVLAKRVKEMVQQCEYIYQNFNIREKKSMKSGYRTTHFFRPAQHMNSYESVCQSLDRVTRNLKNVKIADKNDKNLQVLLEAIRVLSRDFEYCAAKFENFKDRSSKAKKVPTVDVATEVDLGSMEKPYAEWIHEMRYSANGRRFLDRIAVSLRKALNKQKEQLLKEAHIKQQHQQELIKLRYRQKYMDMFSRNSTKEQSDEAKLIGSKIEKQLQEYEIRYNELFERLSKYEKAANQRAIEGTANPYVQALSVPSTQVPVAAPSAAPIAVPVVVPVPAPVQTPVTAPVAAPVPTTVPAPNYREVEKQLEAAKSRLEAANLEKIEKIVKIANRRIEDLETESSLVDQDLQEFQEKQRKQRETEREAVCRLLATYNRESEKINERLGRLDKLIKQTNAKVRTSDPFKEIGIGDTMERDQREIDIESIRAELNARPIEFHNAITEAKKAFFHGDQPMREIRPFGELAAITEESHESRTSAATDEEQLPMNFCQRAPTKPHSVHFKDLSDISTSTLTVTNTKMIGSFDTIEQTNSRLMAEVFSRIDQAQQIEFLDMLSHKQNEPKKESKEKKARAEEQPQCSTKKSKSNQPSPKSQSHSSEESSSSKSSAKPAPVQRSSSSRLLQLSMEKMQQLFSGGRKQSTPEPAPPASVEDTRQDQEQQQEEEQPQLIEIRSEIFETSSPPTYQAGIGLETIPETDYTEIIGDTAQQPQLSPFKPSTFVPTAQLSSILNSSQEYTDSIDFSEDDVYQNLPPQLQQLEVEQRARILAAKEKFKHFTQNTVAFNASTDTDTFSSSPTLKQSEFTTFKPLQQHQQLQLDFGLSDSESDSADSV